MAMGLWIAQQFFKAVIFGNAVRVTENQYPKINEIVKNNCTELGLVAIPDVFIVNGQGAVNAVAIKFLSKKYVLLFSDLVDLMLKRDEINELKMVIGHELAHHAAGHTNVGRNLLIGPAKFVPFLGPAYSRACELTADRIGHKLTEDGEASKRALISIASGSESLASDVNIEAFKNQEAEIPPFFGFLHEIFGTHPRMTKRIMEIEKIM
jgi:Zn-dependent protease with chaperone function